MKKILRRKQVFKGKLLDIRLERRKLPNGYAADLEIVKHPGAALVVPFLSRDKIVLIRQYRPVIDSYVWELPAGTLEKNESPAGCARRELKEETGYAAEKLKKMGYIYPAPGYTTEKIVIYRAEGLKKIKSKKEADEVIAPKALNKKSIKRMLKEGKITDAKTICALALTAV